MDSVFVKMRLLAMTVSLVTRERSDKTENDVSVLKQKRIGVDGVLINCFYFTHSSFSLQEKLVNIRTA